MVFNRLYRKILLSKIPSQKNIHFKMNEIFNAALKYHDLGFNLTYINPKKNDPLKKKIYKAPTNNRQKLKKKKQEFDELISFDWKNWEQYLAIKN